MKNRFDLEEDIGQLYNLVNQIGFLRDGISESNLTDNEIISALDGIKIFLAIQANKIQDTMNQCFKLDKYRNTETKIDSSLFYER